MLNYVAAQIVLFGLRSDFLRQAAPASRSRRSLSDFVDIPQIIDPAGDPAGLGFVVALLMAVVVSWLLFRTTKGFELRAAGFNMTAARYAGMSAAGSIILAMALSGALAGLGGSMEVLGTVPAACPRHQRGLRVQRDRARPARGPPASSASWLAALLFGALTYGRRPDAVKPASRSTCCCSSMALVIMFVAAPGLIRCDLAARSAQEDTGRAGRATEPRRD